jgi:hypothetical protein
VNNAAPTAASAHLWSTEFHREDAVTFKADITNFNTLAGEFFLR